jgi:hypothetical protein
MRRHAGAGGWTTPSMRTVLALAGVLAAGRGPGWRILRGMCSSVWLYLGVVAALVLPHHPGSWGRIGGAVAFLSALDSALPLGAAPNVK